MFFGLLFLFELIFLFISSQFVTRLSSAFILRKTKSQTITINILSSIFLPGVIVHELAHWFVASILFVPTGEIEFLPKLEGNIVKLGSVAVAKTDPFRRFLIGVAPIFGGLGILALLFYYLSQVSFGFNWQTGVLLYASFEVGNTMFSSKKDMEGALGLVISCIVAGIIIYFLGFRLPVNAMSVFSVPGVVAFLQKGSFILIFPLIVNLVTISIFTLVP